MANTALQLAENVRNKSFNVSIDGNNDQRSFDISSCYDSWSNVILQAQSFQLVKAVQNR